MQKNIKTYFLLKTKQQDSQVGGAYYLQKYSQESKPNQANEHTSGTPTLIFKIKEMIIIIIIYILYLTHFISYKQKVIPHKHMNK